MVTWAEFEASASDLAAVGRGAFDRTELVMLGTIRKDGSPRISPIEYAFFEGDLLLGMMWRSMKALDLMRDPRLVAHAVVGNKDGRTDPEFKLYGRAVDVTDPEKRARFGDFTFEQTAWRPPEPYHLFALDIESAAYTRFEEGGRQHLETWPSGGARVVRDSS